MMTTSILARRMRTGAEKVARSRLQRRACEKYIGTEGLMNTLCRRIRGMKDYHFCGIGSYINKMACQNSDKRWHLRVCYLFFFLLLPRISEILEKLFYPKELREFFLPRVFIRHVIIVFVSVVVVVSPGIIQIRIPFRFPYFSSFRFVGFFFFPRHTRCHSRLMVWFE